MVYFTASTNKFYIYWHWMYIVFILQCQKAQNTCQIVWKEQKQSPFLSFLIVSSAKSTLILLPFLTVALHESGTRKSLLVPWLNNTEVFWPPLLPLKITQLQDKQIFLMGQAVSMTENLMLPHLFDIFERRYDTVTKSKVMVDSKFSLKKTHYNYLTQYSETF